VVLPGVCDLCDDLLAFGVEVLRLDFGSYLLCYLELLRRVREYTLNKLLSQFSGHNGQVERTRTGIDTLAVDCRWVVSAVEVA
jgi:hypothetical protein